MVTRLDLHDWRDRKIREWLLLLLRFALTRELSDQSAALAMADELDAVGGRWSAAAPSFFRRTSREVCDAILAPDSDQQKKITLQKHLARIDDIRLKRAFQGVLEARSTAAAAQKRETSGKRRNNREHLWRGLAKA